MISNYVKDEYLDRFGNILNAPKKDIAKKPEQTENPSKINADFWAKVYDRQNGHLTDDQKKTILSAARRKWATQTDKELRTMEYDSNPDISLDEDMGIALLASINDDKKTLGKIRIWKHWYRFYDVIPYLILMKNKWFQLLIFPQLIVMFFTIISCAIGFRKIVIFGKEITVLWVLPDSDTSGRCLAYQKCIGFRIKGIYGSWIFLKLCELSLWIVGMSFKKTFLYYYGYYKDGIRLTYFDQPINKLWINA